MKAAARFCFSIIAVIALCAAANAQGFEGEITLEMTGALSGGHPTQIVIDIKGAMSLVSINAPNGLTRMYNDNTVQKTTIVMANKMGSVIDKSKPDPVGTKVDTTTPVGTGQKKTINGYGCELYTVTNSDGSFDYWMTDGFPKEMIKPFGQAVESGISTSHGSQTSPLARLVLKGLAPVQTDIKRNGQVLATVTFDKYEKKSLSDSMFVVPSDVKIMDPKSMMGNPAQGGHQMGNPVQGGHQ